MNTQKQSRASVLYKAVRKNFLKFTGKNSCDGEFFIKKVFLSHCLKKDAITGLFL